jgi:cell division protein ZapA (FtsZ GTPase activity inhibitor)
MMRIDLLGASFQIQSDESPEYIDRLLTHFRSRIEQIEQSVATADPLRKAILAALLVTDELFSERDGNAPADKAPLSPADAEEIDAITSRLLRRLDSTLPDVED